jgi:hypothetical protein
MNFHGLTLVEFDWRGRMGAFAFAGNTQFALSAVRKCKRELEQTASRDAGTVIEEALNKEYKRVVFAHPLYGVDANLDYWLSIAVPSLSGPTELYATHEHTIHRVDSFEPIGIGAIFARHVVGSSLPLVL